MSSSRGWTGRAIAVAVAFAAAAVASPAAGAPPPSRSSIVDVAIAFPVKNVNRSQVPCPSDGEDYAVRGRLLAPGDALRVARPGVTLLLHGRGTGGEAPWRQKVLPGYDTASELARLGHAVVVVDQLGYGASSVPFGFGVCIGGLADVAAQVVEALRRGAYTTDAPAATAFSRVAVVGHSMGAGIAQISAYSFANVDALAILGYAAEPPREGAEEPVLDASTVCGRGGEPKRRGGQGGYVHVLRTSSIPFFYGTDPRVAAAVKKSYERDACGELLSQVAAVASDQRLVSSISVPVLVMHGDQDPVVPDGAGERQARRYSGSRDVTHVELAATGHFLMLGRTAPVFRRELHLWLSRHGV